MSKSSIQEATTAPHSLTLSNRSSMQLTGINEVLSFDETLIIMITSCGQLSIAGKGLHMLSLLPQDGRVEISGQICEISYKDHVFRSRRLLKDIFK